MTDPRCDSADMFVYLYENEPETGLWCPACALPSGVRASANLLGDSGVSLDAVVIAKCEDCGAKI